MRSNRERMKSAAARFSSVSVSRPRSESPARKNRSARRSSCRMESFCGARCCAASDTAAATQAATTSDCFMRGIMYPKEETAENAEAAEKGRHVFHGDHTGRGTKKKTADGAKTAEPSRRKFTPKVTTDTKHPGHDATRPALRARNGTRITKRETVDYRCFTFGDACFVFARPACRPPSAHGPPRDFAVSAFSAVPSSLHPAVGRWRPYACALMARTRFERARYASHAP